MDNTTKQVIESFLSYLTQEFQKDKNLRHIQLSKWTLHDMRLTVKFFIHEKNGELYFDIREVKENVGHYGHLLGNAVDQLKERAL